MKETDIQNAICEYLEWKRYFFWRSNNTPIFDTKRGVFRRMPKYAMKGVADIIVLHGGKAYFLEVKMPKAYQQKVQKVFEKKVNENGGFYKVVRSVEDVERIL